MTDGVTKLPEIEKGIYVHYKSDHMRYEVLGVGLNTETKDAYVVYRPLYEGDINPDFWIRPYDMFIESVEVDGQTVPRFKKIDT